MYLRQKFLIIGKDYFERVPIIFCCTFKFQMFIMKGKSSLWNSLYRAHGSKAVLCRSEPKRTSAHIQNFGPAHFLHPVLVTKLSLGLGQSSLGHFGSCKTPFGSFRDATVLY